MAKIEPSVSYLNAWAAVNRANMSGMQYSSVSVVKQSRPCDEEESGYLFRSQGVLAQLLHAVRWHISPRYREKNREDRLELLNMIEDEIRTSLFSAKQAKYAANGLSPQGVNDRLKHDEKASVARRAVWKDGLPPEDIPAKIGDVLKYAEENIGNRRVFLDALHCVFLEAAATVKYSDDEGGSEESFLFTSDEDPIDYTPREKKAGVQETVQQRELAVENESDKLRKHPERNPLDNFQALREMKP